MEKRIRDEIIKTIKEKKAMVTQKLEESQLF